MTEHAEPSGAPPRYPAGPWLSRVQAAEHLGVSLSTFDRMRAAGVVRDHLIAGGQRVRRPRFSRPELDATMVPAEVA